MPLKYQFINNTGRGSPIRYLESGDSLTLSGLDDNDEVAHIVNLRCETMDTYGEVFIIDDPFVANAVAKRKLTLDQAKLFQGPESVRRIDFGSEMDFSPATIPLMPKDDKKPVLLAVHVLPNLPLQ